MNAELADIIRKAGAGDLSACRQIYESYSSRIINFIYKMVENRDDAEDLTQDVFFRAFSELKNLLDPECFEPWLYRIARNEVYQSFRKKRTEKELRDTPDPEKGLGFDPADSRPTPQDVVLQGELGTRIQSVLRSLPPKLREVFILAVIHEKSYAEVSDIVGRSLLSVKTDIFRARQFARKSLRSYLEAVK